MTPTDTIIALEKALEAGPTPGEWTLWGRAEPSQTIASADGFIAQTVGGNDSPNAQWIAACSPLAIRTLLDAHASALKDAAALREVLDTSRSALLANHKWHQDYDDHGGYEGSDLESTNLGAIYSIESVESVSAALDDNTKGAAPELAGLGINGSRCGTHGTSGS